MSRIPTPASIEAAPAAAQPHLQAVHRQLGVVPMLLRLVAQPEIAIPHAQPGPVGPGL